MPKRNSPNNQRKREPHPEVGSRSSQSDTATRILRLRETVSNMSEIARILGVSRERVRQVCSRAGIAASKSPAVVLKEKLNISLYQAYKILREQNLPKPACMD